MSVIAARVLDDKVELAADSILIHGSAKRTDNFSKLISVNDMIIGGVGDAEELSLMWHYMETHKPASIAVKDILSFTLEFARWKSDLDGSTMIENEYLLAYQGHLFHLAGKFVYEVQNFAAIGAGEAYATAALYLGHDPIHAVEVSCQLCCYVSDPIVSFTQSKNTSTN